MADYDVVSKWVHGLWELEIPGAGITQSPTAEGAEEVIRDYLDCLGFAEVDTASIAIEWQAVPVIDFRSSDEIIGYDENGLPS
jgi:hypothetical protein